MKVFVARHGVTDWNEENRVQGDSDLPQLGRRGFVQITRLGDRLKNIKIDGVFYSPLIRAVDTAVQVILAREEYPYAYHDINELKERNAGDFTGMIKPEDGVIRGIPDTSEPIEHLRIRAKQAWEKIKEIAQENNYESILIVGHLGINRALVAEILGYEDIQQAKKQHNAALSIYDVSLVGSTQIIVENDVTHLKDMVTASTADL